MPDPTHLSSSLLQIIALSLPAVVILYQVTVQLSESTISKFGGQRKYLQESAVLTTTASLSYFGFAAIPLICVFFPNPIYDMPGWTSWIAVFVSAVSMFLGYLSMLYIAHTPIIIYQEATKHQQYLELIDRVEIYGDIGVEPPKKIRSYLNQRYGGLTGDALEKAKIEDKGRNSDAELEELVEMTEQQSQALDKYERREILDFSNRYKSTFSSIRAFVVTLPTEILGWLV